MSTGAFTLVAIVTLVGSVVAHEVAHGFIADRLGDDTARRAGRLTLNPLRHLDPVGSVLLPLLGALSGLPIIGYARPVPVRPSRLRSPRRDMVLVALGGPGTNFAIAAVAVVVARLTHPAGAFGEVAALAGDAGTDGASNVYVLAVLAALINAFLGLFNLLPLPPLDGSRVVEQFLPARWLAGWARLGRYGILIVFALVLVGGVDRLFLPVLDVLDTLVR